MPAGSPPFLQLLDLPSCWEVTAYELGERVLRLHVRTEDRPAEVCPCGHGRWQHDGTCTRIWRDLPVRNRAVIGQVIYQAWKCKCNRRALPASFTALTKGEATVRLSEELTRLALEHSNIAAARIVRVDSEMGYRILSRTLPALLRGYVPPAAQNVGLDVCRKWAVLVDLDTHQRLEACKITQPGALLAMLQAIPWTPAKVVTDMEPQMLAAVREAWPNALQIIDRFHVEQLVQLTVERYMLHAVQQGTFVGHRLALRRTGQSCENPVQQALLNWRDDLNPRFERAINAAELEASLRGWLARVPSEVAGDRRIKNLLVLLGGLSTEISRYADGRQTNGVVEGLNKSIATLYQNSGGLKDKSMRAKILFRPSEAELLTRAAHLKAEIKAAKACF